jgi:hypothetical protein
MDELADAVRRAALGEATLHPRVAARVIHELQGTQRHRDALNPFADRDFEEDGAARVPWGRDQGLPLEPGAKISGRAVHRECRII